MNIVEALRLGREMNIAIRQASWPTDSYLYHGMDNILTFNDGRRLTPSVAFFLSSAWGLAAAPYHGPLAEDPPYNGPLAEDPTPNEAIATMSNNKINTLTSDDWLQIEQAAKGAVSGLGADWPALMIAIAKISGQPVPRLERKSAHWLIGFCEAVTAILSCCNSEKPAPAIELGPSLPEQCISNPKDFEQMAARLLRAMSNWLAIAEQKAGSAAGKNYVATSLIVRAKAELALYVVQFNKISNAAQISVPSSALDTELPPGDIDYRFLVPGDCSAIGDEIFLQETQKWVPAPIGYWIPAPHPDGEIEPLVIRRMLPVDDDFLDCLGGFNNLYRSEASVSVFTHNKVQGLFVRSSSDKLGTYVRWMMGDVEMATICQRSKLISLLSDFS